MSKVAGLLRYCSSADAKRRRFTEVGLLVGCPSCSCGAQRCGNDRRTLGNGGCAKASACSGPLFPSAQLALRTRELLWSLEATVDACLSLCRLIIVGLCLSMLLPACILDPGSAKGDQYTYTMHLSSTGQHPGACS